MKRLIFICVLFAFMLSGCGGWTVQPLPYISPSPLPSSTPIILSATPIILPLPVTATSDVTPAASTDTPALTDTPITSTPESFIPTGTDTQAATSTMTVIPTTSVPVTFTPSVTSTPFAVVQTTILGCSNGIDITHGMGEVTNAYITIQNTGNADLTNVCATLNALGEGRIHPDKTKCVASLPAGYQVSEKLTVDSTFGKDSPVQVDVNSGLTLLQRVAQNSCADFSLFGPKINNLGTVTPIPTP